MSKINGRPPKQLLNKRVAIIHHRWLICKYLVLYFLCFVMLSLLVWLFTCLLVMVMVRGLEIVPLACTSNFPPWSCRDFRFRARLEIGSRLLHSRLSSSLWSSFTFLTSETMHQNMTIIQNWLLVHKQFQDNIFRKPWADPSTLETSSKSWKMH